MTALLVVDLQTAMFDGLCFPPIHNAKELIVATQRVLGRARSQGVPVVFIRHNSESPFTSGEKGWTVLDVFNVKSSEAIVDKTESDSFAGTVLADKLAELNVTNLVIVGAQTDQCVNSTTLSALDRGFTVTVVSDAHSTWSDPHGLDAAAIIETHNRQFKEAGAQVVSSNEAVF
ncbi:isochorismatase hydrolase [Obelidium mucronatum]|nr:isochorismatase hydrolase [Obelidium mucronatum]